MQILAVLQDMSGWFAGLALQADFRVITKIFDLILDIVESFMIFSVIRDELDEITSADFQNRRELSRSNICIPWQPCEERKSTEALPFL